MRKAPVAYQLYSARELASQDLLSVLKALRKMGYDIKSLAIIKSIDDGIITFG